MSPGDQIRHLAPAGAHFYRLVHRTSSGAQRTIPADPVSYLLIENRVPSIAPGRYDVLFFDVNCKQLISHGKTLIVAYEHSATQQVQLFADSDVAQAGEAAARAPAALAKGNDRDRADEAEPRERRKPRSEEPDAGDDDGQEDADDSDNEDDDEGGTDVDEVGLGRSSRLGSDDANDDDDGDDEDDDTLEGPLNLKRAQARDRLESREQTRHLRMLNFQLKSDERAQKNVRASMYAQEVGETHQLNAIFRREVVEANRIAALSNRRGFDELGRYREANAALRDDMQQNNDVVLSSVQKSVEKTLAVLDLVLDKAAAKLSAPPPPSTDFTGLGQSAIEVIGKLGVALLNRGAPPERTLPPATPANQKAIPDGNPAGQPAKTETAQASRSSQAAAAAPSGGGHPALARLAAKFAGMGEIELARRMSTPDGWQALFNEIGLELEQPPTGVTEAVEDKK